VAQAVPQPSTVVVQVDGRVRERLPMVPGTSREEVIRRAQGAPAVRAALQGRRVSTVVYVPGRILNFVTATGRSRPSP
jgi:leucyl-tRNA synthetase